ncbi:MAG: Txe/YoeB family addiction module toxin [Azospirillaceae bacterium]|nr:Txe/YoeB family addiction module toxin [Azospirillaceae bacterium]
MKLVWSDLAWDDYLSWQEERPEMVRKINALIKDVRRDPFRGLGKPEPLKGAFQGWWSRRITGEHRLVYRVTGEVDIEALEIAQCRFHY